MNKEELFDWAQQFVRPTDSQTAHEAVKRVDIPKDRSTIWKLWNALVESQEWYQTRKVVEFDYLPFLGMDGKRDYRGSRCRSLARRLCDLVWTAKKKYPPPVPLRLLCWTGEDWDKSELLTYTEWGRLVLSDPALMIPYWSLRIKKKENPPSGEVDIEWEE